MTFRERWIWISIGAMLLGIASSLWHVDEIDREIAAEQKVFDQNEVAFTQSMADQQKRLAAIGNVIKVLSSQDIFTDANATLDSGLKEKAVRKTFLTCEAAYWQGVAVVPLETEKDKQLVPYVTLICQDYLTWWDDTKRPSPFMFWSTTRHISRIPPNEWIGYLKHLPNIKAPALPNPKESSTDYH